MLTHLRHLGTIDSEAIPIRTVYSETAECQETLDCENLPSFMMQTLSTPAL